MTRQTPEPLEHLGLSASNRSLADLVHLWQEGYYTVDLPYQRGPVWTEDQRIELIHSIMTGTPIPALIINERPWRRDNPMYAVIDGRQRMETARMWWENRLAVPASWFPADQVETTVDTADGPYVTFAGLTGTGRRKFANGAQIPVATARVATEAEEAAIYLRVNGSGTAQSAADMERAARIAGGS